MVAVAVLAVWAAYGVGTWGWCLVKGYNITFLEWFNPADPYEWDGTPPMVPTGSVLPVASASTSKSGSAQVSVA